MTSKTVVVLSGGLDSAVVAYTLHYYKQPLRFVTFDYGQRHRKEIDYAIEIAKRFNRPHDIVQVPDLRNHLTGSALTSDLAVPEGHYADGSMRVTIVPNRNAILLSIAVGIAVANNYEAVAIGAHAGDHAIYPDCRPEFIDAFNNMLSFALPSNQFVRVEAPFLNRTKTNIVQTGVLYGVPFNLTWSCYKGGELHCGDCGTCVERREAFKLAGVEDPTVYERPESELIPV